MFRHFAALQYTMVTGQIQLELVSSVEEKFYSNRRLYLPTFCCAEELTSCHNEQQHLAAKQINPHTLMVKT